MWKWMFDGYSRYSRKFEVRRMHSLFGVHGNMCDFWYGWFRTFLSFQVVLSSKSPFWFIPLRGFSLIILARHWNLLNMLRLGHKLGYISFMMGNVTVGNLKESLQLMRSWMWYLSLFWANKCPQIEIPEMPVIGEYNRWVEGSSPPRRLLLLDLFISGEGL